MNFSHLVSIFCHGFNVRPVHKMDDWKKSGIIYVHNCSESYENVSLPYCMIQGPLLALI